MVPPGPVLCRVTVHGRSVLHQLRIWEAQELKVKSEWKVREKGFQKKVKRK